MTAVIDEALGQLQDAVHAYQKYIQDLDAYVAGGGWKVERDWFQKIAWQAIRYIDALDEEDDE